MKLAYSFLLLLFTSTLFAQLTPEEAVAGMGRGINLGNTLEPPLEGSWNNGPAQESYFDAYLEAGFTNIRIPVRWDRHTSSTTPFTINESWMNRVEEVVDWGLERGFYITLNGHHEDWLKNNYNNVVLRARYDSIWVQIAERFKDKSEKLLFEIINEPKGMTVAQVDDLNARILGIIRETNPTRIVIYGGNVYSNSQELMRAAIPEDDYIIGYYHAYDPWQFSGQGMGTWGSPNDYQQMTNKYRGIKNWSVANDIPIHHSEFGAIHAGDFNSRMRIYAHNVEQCVINGFAFSVWDDGGDFRILNRANNTWPVEKDILMHYHEDSPNQITSTFMPDTATNEPTIVVEWNNRASDNGNIIVERSVGATSAFVQIAELPADATSFVDTDVQAGKTYTYRIYTNRADGILLHGYPTRLRINATAQTPFKETLIQIPGNLEVEEYDNGGEGLAYHDSDPANIPAGFRLDEGVDIGTQGNGFILEYVVSGEWIEYTVNVAEAGTYSVKAEVASQVANGTFDIRFSKNDAATNFTVPNTGNWYVFQEIEASNTIELEAGEQVVRLNITNNNPFNVDYLTFTLETASSTAETNAIEAGFKIAPNPTEGILNIEVAEVLKKHSTHLELFDMTGKRIATFELDRTATTLDLSAFANGLYMLHLVNDEVSLVHRVVVQ
ncbi:MAG: cellulase family glycosylhydrolase [Bacteroidota bacterium]